MTSGFEPENDSFARSNETSRKRSKAPAARSQTRSAPEVPRSLSDVLRPRRVCISSGACGRQAAGGTRETAMVHDEALALGRFRRAPARWETKFGSDAYNPPPMTSRMTEGSSAFMPFFPHGRNAARRRPRSGFCPGISRSDRGAGARNRRHPPGLCHRPRPSRTPQRVGDRRRRGRGSRAGGGQSLRQRHGR